jgi:hypothetical protein
MLNYLHILEMVNMNSETKEKKKRTTIYLPGDLHSELRIEAIKRRLSMTDLIITSIQHELSSVPNKKQKGND